ncbi:hypothetical protein DM02DRAFT_617570 [Periconia macrospinosa]|uniref:Uncharacterized protein n=1 Tax=Periconia macrospinosa TaxID=97972 RepID=A0A2V1DCS8_9PLEO|nr:hypothetical protein DM02DRAFT_617570 [Periconia macrospinosa]
MSPSPQGTHIPNLYIYELRETPKHPMTRAQKLNMYRIVISDKGEKKVPMPPIRHANNHQHLEYAHIRARTC